MLEKILKNIDKKVENDLEEIEKEKQEKIEKIKKDHKKELKRREEKKEEDFQNETEKEIESFEEDKRREAKFKIQERKREILSDLYSRAQEKLSNLSDKELKKLVKSFLPSSIEGEIEAGQRTAKALKELRNDLKISPSLDEEGFVIKTPEKELDFRFSEIVKGLKEEVEPKVTDILFPNNSK